MAEAGGAAGSVLTDRPLVIVHADRSEWTADCVQRFERYRSAGGMDARVVEAGPSSDLLSVLARSAGSREAGSGPAVLWDASAGMPCKEIELLVRGIGPGEWRAGVRYSRLSVCRGADRIRGRAPAFLSAVRRLAGLVSDPCPPCLALPARTLIDVLTRYPGTGVSGWTHRLLAEARRSGTRIIEAPVMWARRAA